MSKKDYQATARTLHGVKDVDHREAWAVVVIALADVLAADNPRFDRERFVEACETGADRESAKRARKAAKVPLCAKVMGCLCANHARGAAASAVCDATE